MPPVFCAVTQTAAPRGAGLPPVRAASPSACGLATSPPGAFQSQHGQLATGPPLPRPLPGQRLGDPLHGETGASTALVTPHAAALEVLEPSRAWHASSAVHSQRVVPPPPAAPDLSPQQCDAELRDTCLGEERSCSVEDLPESPFHTAMFWGCARSHRQLAP